MKSEEFRVDSLPKLLEAGLSPAVLTRQQFLTHSCRINDPMRAVIHAGVRQVELVEMERPVATPGAIVVKVGAVGICGSDLSVYRRIAHRIHAPRGHAYCGEVVELGDGVDAVRVGQKVAVDVFLESACGKCAFCRRGFSLHCKGRTALNEGGFAGYVRVKAGAAFTLPDNVDTTLGALTEPLAVAIHEVRKMNISRGMSGVVIGAGTIGLMALAAAIDAGSDVRSCKASVSGRSCAGEKVRFFSVDGGHTREVLLNDLQLAEATLAPHGIVLIDDIMSEDWLGVITDTVQYFDDGTKLRPVAFIANKLLCAFQPFADFYRDILQKIAPRSLHMRNVEFSHYTADRYVDGDDLYTFLKSVPR